MQSKFQVENRFTAEAQRTQRRRGEKPLRNLCVSLRLCGEKTSLKRLLALILIAFCIHTSLTSAQQEATNSAANIEAGRRIFTGSCSMGYCHGLNGAGGGGPKLAGRKFSVRYLTMVISDGVPETTMPGFKNNLSKEQLGNLILYVQSLSSSTATESPQPAAQ